MMHFSQLTSCVGLFSSTNEIEFVDYHKYTLCASSFDRFRYITVLYISYLIITAGKDKILCYELHKVQKIWPKSLLCRVRV